MPGTLSSPEPNSSAADAYRGIAAKARAELQRDKKGARAAPGIVMGAKLRVRPPNYGSPGVYGAKNCGDALEALRPLTDNARLLFHSGAWRRSRARTLCCGHAADVDHFARAWRQPASRRSMSSLTPVPSAPAKTIADPATTAALPEVKEAPVPSLPAPIAAPPLKPRPD